MIVVRSIFKEILGDKGISEGELLSYAKLLKAYHKFKCLSIKKFIQGKTIRLKN